ncbi:MAG TPA: TldD/PmbA family protein [Anaerolineae bacterium]|nr:TldD/PmbA family protein [Anaerolineae bacterium]
MRDQMMKALSHSHADFTDIRLEREWRTTVQYRGKNLENLEASVGSGGIVRCLVNNGWGFAVFNTLADLPGRVEEAYEIARLVGSRTTEVVELAPVAPVDDVVRVQLERDPRSVPLQEKQALVQGYNDILLGYDPRIVTTQARYTDFFKEVTIANSEGSYVTEEQADVTLYLAATARDGQDNIQTGFESDGRMAGFEAVQGREAQAEIAARRALDLLDARPATGGVYSVVLNPRLAGVLIHEAFGHLCEADFISKNARLREVLRPGRRFAVDELTVIDEGYLPGLRGNYKYDDEGTPRQRAYLIRNGILEGFLHSRETAARMGAAPTGNARAVSYRFEPIVRMRNTYIDKGTVPFSDMIRDIDRGIYALDAFGGNTMLEQFTFSAGYAYEIVDGQIGGMVRDVVLTGNIFDILKGVDAVGDDLEIEGSAGGCGKGGQYPLPTTMGGPHVRIRNVAVGGRAS